MKVDIYTDTYEPEVNGIVTQVVNLRKQLMENGHEVKLFAPSVPRFKDKDKNVYRLLSLKVIKSVEQRLALPTRNLVSSFWKRADVVHAHTPGPVGAFGLVHARLYRMPYVFTYHTDLTEYTHYILDGKLLRPKHAKSFSRFYCNLSDLIIAPSVKIEKMLKDWGVTRPIRVVSNGVDLDKFRGNSGYLVENKFVRKRDQVILFVGRIAKEKNIEFLIKVFAEIRRRNPRAKLVIAGTGPHKAELEKKAKGTRGIVFTGLVDPLAVANVYASASVFLFSSSTEVHPLCVVEAIASGLPVVGLDDEALNGMVVNGKNGFRVGSESEFVDAVIKILASEKLREEFGRESRSIAVKSYSADASLEKHLEVYREAELVKRGKKIGANKEVGAPSFKRRSFVTGATFLVVVGLLGLFFAFNGPTEIKAASGRVISKVHPRVLAATGVRRIRAGVDTVEDRFRRTKD